jgi:subtilisin family serine protease
MNGHGTHVSSTVGGKIYGIAKQVRLVGVKVLGDDGSGSTAGVIAGIEYVAGMVVVH